MRKPLLPGHYSLWFDPPDEAGDEVLHIVSERRALRLKGSAFREFTKSVVPLLDGKHSWEEIQAATRTQFRAEDLEQCLHLLHAHGIVVEGDVDSLPVDVAERMTPQLNAFQELAPGSDTQRRLAAATVAVLGLGGAGAAAALALGAAGVGTVRCVDWLPVRASDIYLSPFIALDQVGAARAASIADALRRAAPQVDAVADTARLESENDIQRAIAGASFVLCCLDPSLSNLIYKLNRVCLAAGMPWMTCLLSGAEVTVGPSFHPRTGPCYMCYRMRAIACAGNPEEAFAYERLLDRRKSDESARRDSLVFGAGLSANLLALEVVKELTQIAEPSLVGRILTVRLTDLSIERHTVLRKPWCPSCFPIRGVRDVQ